MEEVWFLKVSTPSNSGPNFGGIQKRTRTGNGSNQILHGDRSMKGKFLGVHHASQPTRVSRGHGGQNISSLSLACARVI